MNLPYCYSQFPIDPLSPTQRHRPVIPISLFPIPLLSLVPYTHTLITYCLLPIPYSWLLILNMLFHIYYSIFTIFNFNIPKSNKLYQYSKFIILILILVIHDSPTPDYMIQMECSKHIISSSEHIEQFYFYFSAQLNVNNRCIAPVHNEVVVGWKFWAHHRFSRPKSSLKTVS